MATAYLEHTLSAAGTNGNKKATFSAWMKRATNGVEHVFYTVRQDSSNFFRFRFDSDKINVTSNTSGTNYYATTDAVYRDPSAFYHVVVAYDTTQGTAANRIRIYVNGVEQSKSASNYPSQDATLFMIASGQPQRVGQESGGGYFDGIMTHVHYTEGYAYAATDFGETDSTSGIWKPKTAPSVTYGTNGFFLKFENSGAMGTDSSGNSNTFTVSGTLTQNVDTPSNNFCTFNGVNPYSGTLSNGNLKMSQASYDYNVQGTLGMESGKYYWEYKIDGLYGEFGVCEQGKAGQSDPQANIGFYFLYNNGNTTGYIWNNATAGSQSSTITIPAFASGMIINLAYDADNKALYIGQNGTWLNSGDPTSGASKTGALITNLYPRFGGTIVPFCGHGTSNTTANYEANFGQGYFGTTAVASAGTAPSEGGIFEYDCPTGYQSLCTKGINSF